MTKKQRIFCGVLLALLSMPFVSCKNEPETAVPPIITIEPTLIMQTFSGSATFYGTAKGVRDDLQVTINDFATEPTITANEYRFATSVENGRWSFTIDTVNGTTCTDGRTVQLADGCYELTVTAIATSTVLGVSGMYVFAKAPFLVENTQNGNVIPELTIDTPVNMQTVSGIFNLTGKARGVRENIVITLKEQDPIQQNEYNYSTSVINGEWSFSIDTVNGSISTDGRRIPITNGMYLITVKASITSLLDIPIFTYAYFMIDNTQQDDNHQTDTQTDTSELGNESQSGNSQETTQTGNTEPAGNEPDTTETGNTEPTGNVSDTTQTGNTEQTGNEPDTTQNGNTEPAGNSQDTTETGNTEQTGNEPDTTQAGNTEPTGNESGNTQNDNTGLTGNEPDTTQIGNTEPTSNEPDSTPPVIMLDTPDLKQATMSRDVQFEGKIYDQSDVTEMKAVICSAAGNEIVRKDVNITNNSTWKVTFDGEEDLGLPNSPILSDGETYYYYVFASDSVGNSSEYFFHKLDVYTQFTGRKLNINEWAAFDKGDTDNVQGDYLDREWFESIRIPTDISVEYENRPKFTYSDKLFANIVWSNLNANSYGDISNLNSGDSIIGSITPPTGVDAPFDDTTFKCYIAPSISGSPFVIDPDAGITGIKKKVNDVIITEEATDSNKWPGNISISRMGSGRTFNISTELPEDHPMTLNGQSYYVYIEIQNAIHTKFFAEQAFNLNLSTPKLKITTESLARNLQTTTNDKANFIIEGIALISSEEHGCNLTYECLKDGDAFISEGTVVEVDYNTGYWCLPIDTFEDGIYAYTFTAESAGFKTVQSRILCIDTTNPTLEIMAISQDTNGNKVTISGRADDNLSGLSSIKYRLSPLQTTWTIPTKAYNWGYEINTSLADEVEHTFEIQVTDIAGNTTSALGTIVINHSNQ